MCQASNPLQIQQKKGWPMATKNLPQICMVLFPMFFPFSSFSQNLQAANDQSSSSFIAFRQQWTELPQLPLDLLRTSAADQSAIHLGELAINGLAALGASATEKKVRTSAGFGPATLQALLMVDVVPNFGLSEPYWTKAYKSHCFLAIHRPDYDLILYVSGASSKCFMSKMHQTLAISRHSMHSLFMLILCTWLAQWFKMSRQNRKKVLEIAGAPKHWNHRLIWYTSDMGTPCVKIVGDHFRNGDTVDFNGKRWTDIPVPYGQDKWP